MFEAFADCRHFRRVVLIGHGDCAAHGIQSDDAKRNIVLIAKYGIDNGKLTQELFEFIVIVEVAGKGQVRDRLVFRDATVLQASIDPAMKPPGAFCGDDDGSNTLADGFAEEFAAGCERGGSIDDKKRFPGTALAVLINPVPSLGITPLMRSVLAAAPYRRESGISGGQHCEGHPVPAWALLRPGWLLPPVCSTRAAAAMQARTASSP